jgi:adenine-specific DNA-methyltransferase
MDITSLESHRLELQQQCDQQRTQHERNRLGQFATPPALASEIVAESLRLLGHEQSIQFLDPAFGTGSFYSALLRLGGERVIGAVGFEIDSHYGIPAQRLWEHTNLTLKIEDFTKAVFDTPNANLVICNPPYVRHHHLSASEKLILGHASESLGVKLSGLAGLYCYFMVLAHRCLLPGAVSAWLVPSEFMDVNYGEAIKQYLLKRVTLLRLHRFDSKEVQFSDALVSSAIVWFRNTPPSGSETVQVSYGGSLDTPSVSASIFVRELQAQAKWTRIPSEHQLCADEGAPSVRIGDLFTIKRGLATGDNGFFILSEKRISELGISQRFLKPILPSPRYLKQDIVEADSCGLPLLDRRLFLIDCSLDEHALREAEPALAEYLETGKKNVAAGYLCSSRSPWYSQEKRPPAPFLCTYMGRTDGDGRTFRFILNRSAATAANVYLLMYPKPAIRHSLDQPAAAQQVFELLKNIPMPSMTSEGRVYGGGLHKLEPRELANVPAEAIAAALMNRPTKGVQMKLGTSA